MEVLRFRVIDAYVFVVRIHLVLSRSSPSIFNTHWVCWRGAILPIEPQKNTDDYKNNIFLKCAIVNWFKIFGLILMVRRPQIHFARLSYCH